MALTSLDALDLFFRFGAIGQLVLYAVTLALRGRWSRPAVLLLVLTPCIAAYLMLDAPTAVVAWADSGLVLALSHATPFVLWAFALNVLDPRLHVPTLPVPATLGLGALIAAYFIFFGLVGVPALVHEFVHGLGLAAVAHVIYIAVRDLGDDLIEPRRAFRVLLVGFVAAQTALVLGTEMLGITTGEARFGPTVDSGLFFAIITATGLALLDLAHGDSREGSLRELTDEDRSGAAIEPADRTIYEALMQFVDAGGYRTTNLSIGRLSADLGVPEHRLRRVINEGLGYRNFSAFLNTYRIAEACKRFASAGSADRQVLSIALDLGYGSVGPFNRAFRERTGKTPSAYRKEHEGRHGDEFE